ncbi:monocarboxylate transporter 10-like isoform X3, partial [Dinothrombium tinctorium]
KKRLKNTSLRIDSTILKAKVEMGSSEKDDHQKDSGIRCWLVCFTSFLANGIIFGTINNFGIFFFQLKTHYKNEGDALISLAGSLCIGITFFISPLTSIITDRFGIQKTTVIGAIVASIGMFVSSFTVSDTNISSALFCLTYGLILGIGYSLVYAPSLVILGHYFEKRLGFVNGIAAAGSSVFTVILPLFLPFLFTKFGVRTTYQFLTLLTLVLVLCALSFIERAPKPTAKEEGEEEKICIAKDTLEVKRENIFNRSIWQNKMFVLWIVGVPLALFGYFVPYIFLVTHVKQILPDENAELLVTFIGAFSGIGRLLFGKVSDLPQFNPIALQQLAFISIGLLTLLLVLVKNYTVLIVLCSGFGLFDGCFISLIGPVAHNIVGQVGASQAIGFLLGSCSIPLTIGPPVAEYLYGIYGNYTLAFILAGIPPFVGAVMMLPIIRMQRNEAAKQTFMRSVIQSSLPEHPSFSGTIERIEDSISRNSEVKEEV